jgi:hypothetical protein
MPMIRVDTSGGRLGTTDSTRHYISTLAGGQRLIRVDEPGTPADAWSYRAQQDDSFTRYQYRLPAQPGTPGSWTALLTDGTTYHFVAADWPQADSTGSAARWFLTRIVDRQQNQITFGYSEVRGQARNGTATDGALPDVAVDLVLSTIQYTWNDTHLASCAYPLPVRD